ncbi:hypothetical protein [Desulfobacter curvatus]|uniref:hypothetical protein n=1 Tax=Desulfobacter curvatus TaxID=2290 RepID=UPI00037791F8|nr:hypothetical protein [Desulfobacter curvatus]
MSLASLLGSNLRHPGECIVKIGGTEFSAFYPNLETTVVRLNRKGSAEATLTFKVLRDGADWPMDNNAQVRTWAQIEIIVVFGDSETPFFSGYIKEIGTDTGRSGTTGTITLTCQDIYAAMDRNCRRVTWDEGRDGLDIIREVIRPYGLTLVTDLSSLPLANTHQNVTDYRFIRGLATHNQYEWYLRDQQAGLRELHFGNPQTSAQASTPKLMVRAGRQTNCLSFNVGYDGYQPDRVRFSTAPLSGTEINMETTQPDMELFGTRSADSSESGLETFEWCLPPEDLTSETQAAQRGQAQANDTSFKLKATGKLDGTAYGALLLPGSMVEVGGTGQNDGKWYVDQTTHTFDPTGYFVDFTLIRNASAGDETSDDHILAGIL